MAKWKLKDKDGKYRSSRAFKQDQARDSKEPWEVKRRAKKVIKKPKPKFFGILE